MEIQKLKSIIIDDSAVQRALLAKIVDKHPHLELIASFRNGIDAKSNNAHKDVDLLFLDIEMPLVDGFDLLDAYKTNIQTIIVSSKPEYALRAFDYDVIDYLLKPVDLNRFDKAINKAIRNAQMKFDPKDNSHLFVKSNFRKVKINYDDIKWVEAMGDYIKLVTEKTNHIVLKSMKAFEKELPEGQFLRVHKSYIINLRKVEKLNNTMIEIDGIKMPISRNRRSLLMQALGI